MTAAAPPPGDSQRSAAAGPHAGRDGETAPPGADRQAGAPAGDTRMATGVPRLDHLLDGGLRPEGRVLLYGPPFLGKETLARRVLLTNLRQRKPVILVVTNDTAKEVRRALARMDKDYPKYEGAGLMWFVDAYSRSIDADEETPNVRYVDSAVDLNGISLAVNQIQAKLIEGHDEHLLVLDSASTLVLYSNAAATFRFLQVLVGRARGAGALSLVLLDQGMHTPAEVQMFHHLVDGVIELREERDQPKVQVRGLPYAREHGWLDYRFDDAIFEVTGSLAAGRIR